MREPKSIEGWQKKVKDLERWNQMKEETITRLIDERNGLNSNVRRLEAKIKDIENLLRRAVRAQLTGEWDVMVCAGFLAGKAEPK